MKRPSYPIDEDFKKYAKAHPPLFRPLLPLVQATEFVSYCKQRSKNTVKIEKKTIILSPKRRLKALFYTPEEATDCAPCLVFYHGGGFVLPAASYQCKIARTLAEQTGCKAFFLFYRLAPRHKFPAAVDDCFDGYSWLIGNAASLGIDSKKIIVGGDSAGGNLAAVVCLKAREEEITPPLGQMLLYPALSDENTAEQPFQDAPMCSMNDYRKFGKLYLPKQGEIRREHLFPSEAEANLFPTTYLETAAFDYLRAGGLRFCEKLRASGVPVEHCDTENTIHAYDIVPNSKAVKYCTKRRVAFLKKLWHLD